MRIFSVFSFKGGVGRTALVASLGAHWAQRGKVVALVDMDLTAPGLSLLSAVRGWTVAEADGLGVGDMLDVFNRSLENNQGGVFDLLAPTELFRVMEDPTGDDWGGPGKVYVIDAGRPDTLRPETEGAVIPHNIPPRHGHSGETTRQGQMRALAEAWRKDFAEWRTPDGREIDMVLVDCRTGFPELMDLTLGYLADEIVLVSGINPQNLEGLNLTLRALTAQRLSSVTLGTLTVVLSPIPASDDDATLGAIDRAHRVIDTVVKDLGTKGTVSFDPKVYTLPYSTRVANSDPPFLQRAGQTPLPYVQAVEVIAKHLDGREAAEAGIELKQESAPAVAKLSSMTTEFKLTARPMVRYESGNSFLADLPPWHWPLDLEGPEAIEVERNRLTGGWHQKNINADSFLNLLCYATGLSIEEKRHCISTAGRMPKTLFVHICDLLKTKCAEFSRDIALGNLRFEFLDSLMEWAEVLELEKDNIQNIMLKNPLSGRHHFVMWSENLTYWTWIGVKLSRIGSDFSIYSFRKALEISPGDPAVIGNLANSMASFSMCHEKTEFWYRLIIRVYPKYLPFLGNFATFLAGVRNSHDEAECYYRRAVDADPKDVNTLGNFAGFLLARGQVDEGAEIWRRSMEGADQGPPGLTLELWFYAYAFFPDRRDEALAEVTQRLEHGERSPGFNLSHCVAAAREQGHPDPGRVASLAEQISSPRPQ